jgi:O-antigen/teichoic acid export membrane protein
VSPVTLDEEPVLPRPISTARARAVREARPMVWLTAVEGGAKLLSFAFYLIAARVLQPQGFGVVQYTITVGAVAFGALQVLATVIVRELGAVRDDRPGTHDVLGSSLAVAGGLWVLSSLLCLLAQGLGFARGASTLGLLSVLGGTAVFQTYYSIARGTGEGGRQAAAYAGGSLAQLIVFGLLAAFTRPSATTALLIYGASSLVPVVAYELWRPVVRAQPLRVRRHVIRRLWLLGAPLLIAQICYLVWNSLDQLWVEGALGTFQVGLYSSAKNLSQLFIIVPGGITGVLLPRVAQLRAAQDDRGARRLIAWGTVIGVAISALLAVGVIFLRAPLLGLLYGHLYRAAAGALAALSLGMVCYAAFTALTMAAVGWGRPGVYTAGIAVAGVLEALGLAVFGGHHSIAAAWAYAGSIGGALLFVLLMLRVRPLRGEAETQPA